MKHNLIKTALISLLASSISTVYAGEIQIGSGSFEMSGGFVGLTQSINTDIMTYSLVEQHNNFGSSNWFYKYNVTWFDSNKMQQAQQSINSISSRFFHVPTVLTMPAIDYQLQGLDLSVVLGKDIFHQDENDYIGIGVMLGASFPWIESGKNNRNNDLISNANMNLMPDSKTKIRSYKIGPSLTARTSLNNFFTLYGSITYALQTGSIENDHINTSLNINGTFQEFDIGIRFQPLSSDYDLGWITLSPRLYATLGHRHTSWTLDDVNIDITGVNARTTSMDFNMESSVTYIGVGYSF